MRVISFLCLLGVVALVFAAVTMTQMAPLIKPDTPRGSRGLYTILLKDGDFTGPRGPRLRNRLYVLLGAFFLLCVSIAAAIALLPESAVP
jgi:hypothetical protein